MNEMYNNGNDDLFNFLKPHYSETDKLLRAIDNICGTHYLIFDIKKYPLASERKCWDMKILKPGKEDKLYILYHDEGMEMIPMLKKMKAYLEKYDEQHKDYNLQRNGGGENIW